jgi:hypothetical protein
MNNSLQKEQDDSFEHEDTQEPIPPYDIVSYNELRSCADLVRLHDTQKLEVQPDFQRQVVWKRDEQTRFIDSLVKQLPIPSMCFSLDYRTQKWEEQRIYSIVQDVSIPVTVIRCDYTQDNHMRYLFTIFHRLNSGGVRLNNQEIRNCIYTSNFNNILKQFDAENSDWQYVKRRIWGRMDRFRSVEVVLRTMAFGDDLANYDANLARFLNQYMFSQTRKTVKELTPLEELMNRVAYFARVVLEKDDSRLKLPLSLVEAVLVALYVNMPNLEESRILLTKKCGIGRRFWIPLGMRSPAPRM